jgi:hypothetical protein
VLSLTLVEALTTTALVVEALTTTALVVEALTTTALVVEALTTTALVAEVLKTTVLVAGTLASLRVYGSDVRCPPVLEIHAGEDRRRPGMRIDLHTRQYHAV